MSSDVQRSVWSFVAFKTVSVHSTTLCVFEIGLGSSFIAAGYGAMGWREHDPSALVNFPAPESAASF